MFSVRNISLFISLSSRFYLLFSPNWKFNALYNMSDTTNWGGSRTAATSKMERFVIIVNVRKPLTIITKHSILDVTAVLDPSLTNSKAFLTEVQYWKINLENSHSGDRYILLKDAGGFDWINLWKNWLMDEPNSIVKLVKQELLLKYFLLKFACIGTRVIQKTC